MDLAYAFHSDEIDEGYNFGSYSNPEDDRLIDEAYREADVDRKRMALDRIQEILHEEHPYTFLWEPLQINARHRRIQGPRLLKRARHGSSLALPALFSLRIL